MFYYSHVDEQLFSCELLSIFQLRVHLLALEISAAIILFGDTHAALQELCPGTERSWVRECSSQEMEQLGSSAQTRSRLGRERPGPYRALVPDGTDVAAALCHNLCVSAERPKDSPGCASGWHMGPFIFLKGSRGRAHCTCSELILPVPSLLMDSPCWSSRHAFHFFPSVWDH